MEKVRTRINHKWMEDGILRMKVIAGVHIDLPGLIDDAAADVNLSEGKKVLALYDARSYFTISPEANRYVKSGILNKTRIATAVLTDKSFMRLLVNLINNFNKPSSPLKMFDNEKKALEWLKSFRNS